MQLQQSFNESIFTVGGIAPPLEISNTTHQLESECSITQPTKTALPLQPSTDKLLDEYLALFPYRLESHVRRPGSSNWREMSRFHFLSDSEIRDSIDSILSVQRAVSFDEKTRIAALSIPAASPYHSTTNVIEIRRALWAHSIKTVLYELAGDWYIYIFLKTAVESKQIASILTEWCLQHKFELSKDGMRLHPDVPLPLPLQPGFIWLDENCQHLLNRGSLSLTEALNHFLDDLQYSSNSADQLLALLTSVSRQPPTPEAPAANVLSVQYSELLLPRPIHVPFDLTVLAEHTESQDQIKIQVQTNNPEVLPNPPAEICVIQKSGQLEHEQTSPDHVDYEKTGPRHSYQYTDKTAFNTSAGVTTDSADSLPELNSPDTPGQVPLCPDMSWFDDSKDSESLKPPPQKSRRQTKQMDQDPIQGFSTTAADDIATATRSPPAPTQTLGKQLTLSIFEATDRAPPDTG